jgi:hypothetical protein
MLGAIRILILPPHLATAWCLPKHLKLHLLFDLFISSPYKRMDEMKRIVGVYVFESLRVIRYLDRLPK